MVFEAAKQVMFDGQELGKMQRSTPYEYGSFAGLNNNDTYTVNANFSNNSFDEGVIGFQDRTEELPEMDSEADSQNSIAPANDIVNGVMQFIPAGQGCYLNNMNQGYTNSQATANSVPNFTFTTPTQSAMYSPPLVSSNHRYQLQRATPQTFSPTGCAPWQHSIPNRIPWVGQTVGLTVSSQGVSIFTAPLCSRSQISWTNTAPHVTTTQDPSPSCSQIPRRPKRAATGNLEYLSPSSKIHLTERMIADHMQELSINNITWIPTKDNTSLKGFGGVWRGNNPIKTSQFTCIRQQSVPANTSRALEQDIQWQAFRDLEERLELSDDEGSDIQESAKRKPEPKVVFLENIPKHPSSTVIPQKILDDLKKPSLELVLWQPPADVVKDALDKRTEKEQDGKQKSQDFDNDLVENKEDEFTMELDLCDRDDMMML